MIEPNAKLVTFLSQLAAARSDMDADYQRFTRLQTFLLICSLFVGRLAAGNLPLFAVRVSPLLVYLIYSRLLYKFPSCRRCRVRFPEFPLGYPGAGRECLAGVSWRVCAGLPVPVLLQAAFAGMRGRRSGLRRSAGVWGDVEGRYILFFFRDRE